MQLLADQLITLGIVDSISDETVRQTLKKRHKTVVKRTVVYRTYALYISTIRDLVISAIYRT